MYWANGAIPLKVLLGESLDGFKADVDYILAQATKNEGWLGPLVYYQCRACSIKLMRQLSVIGTGGWVSVVCFPWRDLLDAMGRGHKG